MTLLNQDSDTTTTTTIRLPQSPLAPGQIQKTRFSSTLSAEIGISSFGVVGKQWLECARLGQESESRSLPLALFIKAQTWAVNERSGQREFTVIQS